MIAVTGATGEVGRRVVARLDGTRASSSATRARARRRRRAASPPATTPSTRCAPRSTGADTVFLIPAAEAADRVEQHRTAVDAAVAAGVPRLVYLSFLNAAPDATFTLARDHWATEQHIRASGLRWTFLRMNLYMDFIPAMGVDGVIRGPAGDGRVSAILRDDVAAAAAAVLPSDGHDGRDVRPDRPGELQPGRGGGAAGRPLRGRDRRAGLRLTRELRRAGLGGPRAGSPPTRRSATAASTSSAPRCTTSPAATPTSLRASYLADQAA